MNDQSEPERFDQIDDIFEKLEQHGRSRVVAASALEVRTKEGLADARRLVNEAVEHGVVTAAELSRRTGVKQSAISAFRRDHWKGSAGTLSSTASLLVKAIDQLQQQRVSEETSVDGFCKTKVAEAIYSLAQYAIKRRKIVAFTLSPGNGKTMALTQLAYDTPGAILLTVRKTATRIKPFLEAWARVLAVRDTGRADVLQDRITSKIAGSDRLQLIDECHKLPSETLNVIREIWDEARVPCVLSGTPSLYTRLTTKRVGDTSTELLAQLFSRIGIFRDLDEVAESRTGDDDRLHTRDDIRKVFARGHVRLVKDGVDFLFSLANSPGVGGLRICRDLVQLCVDLYPGEPITEERLRAAMVSKLGPREAGYKLGLTSRTEERPAKVAAG